MKFNTAPYIILFVLAITLSAISYGQIVDTGREYISEKASSQRAIFKYLERQRSQDYNRVMNSGEVVASGTEFEIANDVHFLMDGVFGVVTATNTLGLTADEQTANTKCIYLLSTDKNGIVSCTVGSEVADTGTPEVPEVPDDELPFAYVTVTASGAFTLGTTNFTATDDATATNISRLNPLGVENFQGL